MGSKCTICFHPQRAEIEKAIVSGEPERTIASQFSVSKAAVHRHKKHMQIAVPEPVVPPARVDIAQELQNCIEEAKRILKRSENNPRLALASLSVLSRLLETAGRLTIILAEREKEAPQKIEVVLIDAGSKPENI